MAEVHHHTIFFSGRVQGVGYRNWMVDHARALGISGWVRNRSDGTVEAVLQGAAEAVAQLAERAHRGPRAAWVEQVVVEAAEGRYEGFLATETA